MSPDRFRNDATTAATGEIDLGLQAFMRDVYNTMALGLTLTGATAGIVAAIEPLREIFIMQPLVRLIVAFAPLVYLFTAFRGTALMRKTAQKLKSSFYLFSGLMGLSMSVFFMVYSPDAVARAFLVTAATFAGTSLYGYTTKRDLTSAGAFLAMGVWGLLIAMIVNMFMQSVALHFMLSIAGVVIFTGLVAWETQRLKETYAYGSNAGEANDKLAVMGALSLYINFINLFQFILSIMGGSRRN
jgi:FtsH-binding integral membrane protein